MKNYIGISRDHSVSMRTVKNAAVDDYNNNIESIKTNSEKHDQDTIVSVVENGRGGLGKVVQVVSNSSVNRLKKIDHKDYVVDGHFTPLFDSVGMLIEQFEKVPDYKDPQVSFLVMAITDGQDNSSQMWRGHTLATKIKELQATDKWTFVFRVPVGQKRHITQLGIPAGNVQEWDQTEESFQEATIATSHAYDTYFTSRALGKTSTDKFYVNTDTLNTKKVTRALVDISGQVQQLVPKKNELDYKIREFVEQRTGKAYVKGDAFYLLTRTEKVQDYKKICLVDKLNGKIYGGLDARHLLNIPEQGMVKLVPGNINQFNVFIQSTSVNRLVRDKILVWPGAA